MNCATPSRSSKFKFAEISGQKTCSKQSSVSEFGTTCFRSLTLPEHDIHDGHLTAVASRCANSDLCLPAAEKELVCPCKAGTLEAGRSPVGFLMLYLESSVFENS